MLKYILTFSLIALLLSCRENKFYKQSEIRRNAATDKVVYSIWVREDGGELLDVYQIPIDDATKQNVDSLNRVVDSFITRLNNINKYK